MENYPDRILIILQEEGIPEELIKRLQQEEMADLENLEEIITWAPKDISSTLGVPTGLVMPNKFAKRISRAIKRFNECSNESRFSSTSDHSSATTLSPTPILPEAAESPVSKSSSTGLSEKSRHVSTNVKEPPSSSSRSPISRISPQESRRSPAEKAYDQAAIDFSDIPRNKLTTPTVSAAISSLTISGSTQSVNCEGHNRHDPKDTSSTPVTGTTSFLTTNTRSRSPVKTALSLVDDTSPKDGNRSAVRQPGLFDRQESSDSTQECFDSAAKAAMSYYKKSLTEDTIRFTPSMAIDLTALRAVWNDKLGASEDFLLTRFERVLVKHITATNDMTKTEAKDMVLTLANLIRRCDINKSGRVSVLTLGSACRSITPLNASVSEICEQLIAKCGTYDMGLQRSSDTHDDMSEHDLVCLIAAPPLPRKYVAVESPRADRLIAEALSTPGWAVVCGGSGIGKSTRVLAACHGLPKAVDRVWVDMRAEISGESAAISCLAAQLGLIGLGGGGGTAAVLMAFRKYLLALRAGSVVVFNKLHDSEEVAGACGSIFNVCHDFVETISFLIVCESTNGLRDSTAFSKSRGFKRVIVVEDMSPAECTVIVRALTTADPQLVLERAGYLPGNIVALASLNSSYMQQIALSDSPYSSLSSTQGPRVGSPCMELLFDVLGARERLCAASLVPLVGMQAFCDVNCAWALCRVHIASLDEWSTCMCRLKAIGWVTQLTESSDIIITSHVMPSFPTADGYPTPPMQYNAYYEYWAEQMSDISAAYRGGKKLSAVFWFDKYRPHFTRLLTAWHSPYPPTDPYNIACKIAGKIGLFCESRMSPTSASKACRAILRVIEKAEEGQTRSVSYWFAAIELGRALVLTSRLLEALELTSSCVNEIRKGELTNDKSYTRLLGSSYQLLGIIYEALDQTDNAVAYFNESIDVYGSGEDFGLDSRNVAEVQHNLANCYREKGDYQQAEVMYKKSIEAYKAVYATDHIDIADVLTDQGAMYKHKGDIDMSGASYKEALRIRRELLGSEHIDVAHSLNNVAVLLHSDGAYEEARLLYEEALPIYVMMLGNSHADVAASLNNLGALYDDLGNFELARSYYERALNIRRNVLDFDSSDLAASINNLAALLDDHGHPNEAKALYEESLEIYRSSMGNTHPDVASSLINLAALVEDLGDSDEAGKLYKEALDIFISLYGEVHPDVGSTVICIANLAKNMKDFDRAHSLFERAICIYEQVYGRDHVAVAQAMHTLAALLKSQFSYEEAKLLFRESLRIRKKVLGQFHPDVAHSLKSLGILLRAQRQMDAAIAVYREVLDVHRKLYGGAHEEVVLTIDTLATLLKNQSRFAESAELFREAVEINRTLHGEHDVVVADSICRLAQVLKCHRKYADAMLLYDEVLAMRKSLVGNEDPLVAHTLHDMGLLYWAMGSKDDALLLFEECLAIRRKCLPERHPDVIQSLTSMASMLGEDEKYYVEAKRMYEDAITMRIQLLGEGHPEIAVSLMNLAHLAAALSKHGDAKSLLDRALVIRRCAFGERSEEAAQCYVQTAAVLVSQRQYKDSAPLLEDALDIAQSKCGPESRQVGLVLTDIGNLYKVQCKFDKASTVLEEALRILRRATGHENTPSLDVANALKKLAAVNVSMRNYEAAMRQYEEAIDIMQAVLGPEHVDIAAVLTAFGDLFKNDQFYDEARDVYNEALQIRRQSFGMYHLDVVQSLNSLGDINKRTAMFPEARKLFEEALEIRRALLGDNHVDVAQSYHNLAALMDRLGNYDEAEHLFGLALSIRRKVLGDYHPDVAQTLNNIAAILDDQNRVSEAEPLYREALDIYRETFGSDHPDVALSLNNLAALLDDRGEFGRALVMYEEALSITQHIYGDESLEVASAMICLANAFKKLRNYNESETCFRKAISIKENVLGKKHLDVAATKILYAELYVTQGDVVDALELFREAGLIRSGILGPSHQGVLAIQERIEELEDNEDVGEVDICPASSTSTGAGGSKKTSVSDMEVSLKEKRVRLGANHVSVGDDLVIIANAYLDNNQVGDAIVRLKEALSIYRICHQGGHAATATTLNELVGCLRKVEAYGEAEEYAAENIKLASSVFGESSSQLGEALYLLGSIYDNQRKDEEAVVMYMKSLEIRRVALPENSPEIAQTLNNMAAIIDDLGRAEQAEMYYKEALDIYRVVYGSEHPDVALSINNLAALLDDRGCYDEACALYEEALVITKKVFGEQSPEVQSAVICLATVLKSLHRYEEAGNCYMDALKVKEVVGEGESLEAALLHDHLGVMCQMQKQFKRAKKELEISMAIRIKVHNGESHVDVALSHEKLATLCEVSGKLSECYSYLRQALRIRVECHGGRTVSEVANVIVRMGHVAKKKKKLHEALQHYQEALVIYKGCNGATDDSVSDVHCCIGTVLRHLHEHDEAIAFYERSLVIRKRNHGENHASVAAVYNFIGSVLEKVMRYDEALNKYNTALAIQKRVFGSVHAEVARSLTNIAIMLKNVKNLEKAKLYYEEALVIRRKLHGTNHADVAQSMNNLAAVLYMEKEYEPARRLYEESLVILTALMGKEHLDVAQASNNLAALLFVEKKYSEAEELYGESLRVRLQHLGDRHLDVAASLCNLGILKRCAMEYETAVPFFEHALEIRLLLLKNDSHPDVVVCRKHLEFVRQMSIPLELGMVVDCVHKKSGKKLSGTVVRIYSDDELCDVQFNNSHYGVEIKVPRQKVIVPNLLVDGYMRERINILDRFRPRMSPPPAQSSTAKALPTTELCVSTTDQSGQNSPKIGSAVDGNTSASIASSAASKESCASEASKGGQKYSSDTFSDCSFGKESEEAVLQHALLQDRHANKIGNAPRLHSKSSRSLIVPGTSANERDNHPYVLPLSIGKVGASLPPLQSLASLNTAAELSMKTPSCASLDKERHAITARSGSRVATRNFVTRRQSSIAAQAESTATPYRDSVSSAGFRLSSKSFIMQKHLSSISDTAVDLVAKEDEANDFFSEFYQGPIFEEDDLEMARTGSMKKMKSATLVARQENLLRKQSSGSSSSLIAGQGVLGGGTKVPTVLRGSASRRKLV